MDSLPPELILQIASHLPNLASLNSLSRTSKRLSQIIATPLRHHILNKVRTATATYRHAVEFHLLQAAFRGWLPAMHWIIAEWLQPTSNTKNQQHIVNALCLAANKGTTESVKTLLPYVEDVNAVRGCSTWQLFVVPSNIKARRDAGDSKIRRSGINVGRPIGIETLFTSTHANALCEAASNGHVEIINLLLSHPGIDISATHSHGYSRAGELNYLFDEDRFELDRAFQGFVMRQRDVDHWSNMGSDALGRAKKRRQLQVETEETWKFSAPDEVLEGCVYSGMGPLARAAGQGRAEAVRVLLEKGAESGVMGELEAKGWRGPLRQAQEGGCGEVIGLIKKAVRKKRSSGEMERGSDAEEKSLVAVMRKWWDRVVAYIRGYGTT